MTKSISASLQTHLDGEVTSLACCWKITRLDGEVFTFTNASDPLTIDIGDGDGPLVYESAGGFNRTNIENTASMDVDNLDVTGALDVALTADTITKADLRGGKYDYAQVKTFFVNHQDLSAGIIKMRRGRLGEIIVTPNGFFRGEVRGMLDTFKRRLGEVYTKDCRADLGDRRCRVPVITSLDFADTLQRSTAVSLGEYYRAYLPTYPTGFTGSLSNIVNPSFESDTPPSTGVVTGWTIEAGTASDMTIETNPAPSGGSQNFNYAHGLTDPDMIVSQIVDLRVGSGGDIPDADLTANDGASILISVKAQYATETDGEAVLDFQALDASDSVLSTTTATSIVGTGISTYAEISNTAYIPANTAKIKIRLRDDRLGTGHNIRYDLVSASYVNLSLAESNIDPTRFVNVIFEVTTAGTTDTSYPTYDTTVGNTTTDGTAVLTARNAWVYACEVTALTDNRKQFTVTELTPNTGHTITGKTPATLGFEDDYFNAGLAVFYDGNNAGLSMEIKDFVADDGVTIEQDITLFLDMPFDIQVGDVLYVIPGCDKRLATCKAIFNNVLNFVGEPYVPGNDYLATYPDAKN